MRAAILDIYGRDHPDLVFWDSLDAAIIGVTDDEAGNPHVAYSAIAILKECVKNGMSEAEAKEYFEVGILGAPNGIYMPQIVDDLF